MAFDSRQPSAAGTQAAACTPAPQSRIGRLFSRWGPGGAPTSVNPTPMQVNQAAQSDSVVRSPSGSSGEPCWWAIEVNAREVIRRANNVEDVTTSLPESSVKSSGLDTSKLWARAGWHREGIGRSAIFDISAGMRLSVRACNVEVGILTPPECVSLRGNQEASFEGTGTYLDTCFRASVICARAPVRGLALLTQTYVVEADSSIFVPKPPGAVGIEIFVPGANAAGLAAPGNWVEFGDAFGTAIPGGFLGLIPFLTVAAERTGMVPRPGNAAGVASTNGTESTLVYTYVWHLEF